MMNMLVGADRVSCGRCAVATLTPQFADRVSQTLLIPLWARALEQGEPDPLVRDPLAAEIVAQIDYDWRRIRLSRGDLVQCVVRLREFDRFVRDFLVLHPSATVVHLGCGLDARFQRVDDGLVRWFDLDLPDVIALRRKLLPESERNRFVPGSALEPDWIEQLGLSGAGPVLIVAEAVLVYLEGVGVRNLLVALRGRCPGAELITDMCTPLAMRLDNLQLLVTRWTARIRWTVRDPRELEGWAGGIQLMESFSYFEHLEPRTGLPAWLARVPGLSRASSIQRYRLGG
jgi:O-methyltransferase involved in polyketide biosynthesis